MVTLSGADHQRLINTLTDAITEDEFDDLFRVTTNVRLNTIVGPMGYRLRVSRALDFIQSRDRVGKFLLDLRQANATNTALAEVAEEMALGVNLVGSLQKQIAGQYPTFDPASFRASMVEAENRVCQIEVQGAVDGTGFLVGPDKVMTNYHVIERALKVLHPDIAVSFDYVAQREAARHVTVSSQWLVESSPGSALDDRPVAGEEPSSGQLDFAIIRLSERIGEKPPNPAATNPRGWVNLSLDPVDPNAGDVMFIMQHPGGGPERCAAGVFDGFNTSATRMRYKVVTEGGSSGSPCYSLGWKFLGLHNGSEPGKAQARYNQGIPFAAIVAALKASGTLDKLES